MVELNLNVGQVVSLYESGQLEYDLVKSTLNSFSKEDLINHLVGDSDDSDDDSDTADEINLPEDDE